MENNSALPSGALRPSFTAALVKGMRDNHHSYHIVGDEDDGPERLLADLKEAMPDCRSVVLNIRDYKKSFSGLTWEMARQLDFSDEKRSLADLKLHFEKNTATQFRLLLYHFDSLLNRMDIDKSYNNDFVGSLNNFRQMPNVRLVVASAQPGRAHWMHLNGSEQATLSSFFDALEEMPLPKLSREECQREIRRRLPAVPDAMFDDLSADFTRHYRQMNHALDLILEHGLLGRDNWRAELKKRLRGEQRAGSSFSVRLIKCREWLSLWYKQLGIGALLLLLAFVIANWDKITTLLGNTPPPATTEQPDAGKK